MTKRHLLALVLCVVPYQIARAELLFGITDTTFQLVSFDSATPNTITTINTITGTLAGHTLRGIDFRPSNGQLYALSTSTTTASQA